MEHVMTANKPQVAVTGSERAPMRGATAVGPSTPDERLEVTVRLRPRTPLQSLKAAEVAKESPHKRRYLSHDEWAATYGATPEDIAKVQAFAQAHGLAVVATDASRRSVHLSGTVAAFGAAFGVSLEQYDHPDGSYRGRVGPVKVPAELADIVQGVFGLDNRPQARPHFQIKKAPAAAAAHGAAQAGSSFTPVQIGKLYNYPSNLDGSGQCIAIIELGGGYKPADLKKYFTGLGLAAPRVLTVSVDGGRNHPTTADSADGEVMLDIEVAAAVAPKSTIAVYFAPNTDQGFLDAVTKAVHDTVHKPSVVSISWGSAESNWTAQAMKSMDEAFQAAAALGVTVCVAAGDSGSADGETDGKDHVDFPASSPFALGCGGTKLVASGGTVSGETVWNESSDSATGGGVSATFARPDYQATAGVPAPGQPGGGRGVPDVAGDADPNTGYQVRVDGQGLVIGGTSAVAPLMAGLVALLNQGLGRPVGFLNPVIYSLKPAAGAFRDITSGNNGKFSAKSGWDACTGLGVADGGRLLQALRGGANTAVS
jgi:kumamolisin